MTERNRWREESWPSSRRSGPRLVAVAQWLDADDLVRKTSSRPGRTAQVRAGTTSAGSSPAGANLIHRRRAPPLGNGDPTASRRQHVVGKTQEWSVAMGSLRSAGRDAREQRELIWSERGPTYEEAPRSAVRARTIRAASTAPRPSAEDMDIDGAATHSSTQVFHTGEKLAALVGRGRDPILGMPLE